MRQYLIALVMMLASTGAYAQTNLNGTSQCPATPPYNGAVCWNDVAGLWQHGVGGAWINQTGSGGSPSVGAAGTLQQSNGAGGFQAYAGTSCSNQALSVLSAAGLGSCSTITSAFVDTTIPKTGGDLNTSNPTQVTATHLAASLPVAQGGTGAGTFTQFSLLYGNGTSAFGMLLLINDQLALGNTSGAPTAITLPSGGCTSTQSLNYTHGGGFQCQAITATASPGGTTGAVQYNSAGSLGGLNGTGLVKDNGASAPTIAVANTDYDAATTITPAGLHCDGTTDDSSIINTAISGAAAGSVIKLPAGKNCAIAAGITTTTAVGFDGNGSKLTSSVTASGTAAFTINSVVNGANYAGNRVPYRRINLVGPGNSAVNWGTKNSSTTGLLLQASNISIDGLNITGFNQGINHGNYSYTVTINDPQIYANYWGVLFPFVPLTGAGENLNYNGGSIFNNTIGFEDDGGSASEFHFQATSFDYNTTQIIPVGFDTFDHVHVEGITNTPFQMSGGYNNFTHLLVSNSSIVFGSSTPSSAIPLITVTGTGGMYAKFDRIFLSGFQQTNVLGNWITGTGAGQVSVCRATDTFLSATAVDNLGPFGTCTGSALPTSAVVLGTSSTNQFVSTPVQGTGDTKALLASGSFTLGHALVVDANGGASDGGASPAASAFNTAMASNGVMVSYGGL